MGPRGTHVMNRLHSIQILPISSLIFLPPNQFQSKLCIFCSFRLHETKIHSVTINLLTFSFPLKDLVNISGGQPQRFSHGNEEKKTEVQYITQLKYSLKAPAFYCRVHITCSIPSIFLYTVSFNVCALSCSKINHTKLRNILFSFSSSLPSPSLCRLLPPLMSHHLTPPIEDDFAFHKVYSSKISIYTQISESNMCLHTNTISSTIKFVKKCPVSLQTITTHSSDFIVLNTCTSLQMHKLATHF